MKLYHGSNTGGIKILEPRLADHDRPYVYMATIDVITAFYLCNAVERPYYWFPYGFENNSPVPVYHELYPDALKEVSEGVSGYIYEAGTEESQIIPFKNIPCARLATKPVKVKKYTRIDNDYNLFMDYTRQGKMKIGYFKDKTPEQLQWWHSSIINYLEEKNMASIPDCPYARFVKKKFPEVWERYIKSKYKENSRL